MRRSTRLEPISAPSSKTSIIEAGCIQRSATNPRLSSKPNSANSKASERTQPSLCHSNPVSQPRGAVQRRPRSNSGTSFTASVSHRPLADSTELNARRPENPFHPTGSAEGRCATQDEEGQNENLRLVSNPRRRSNLRPPQIRGLDREKTRPQHPPNPHRKPGSDHESPRRIAGSLGVTLESPSVRKPSSLSHCVASATELSLLSTWTSSSG